MIAKVNSIETQDKDALIKELKEQNEFLQHSADPFDRLLYRIRKRKEQDTLSQSSSKRNN